VLSARSPKYPALYDIESGVRFRSGRAQVSEAQARKLADRRYVDGILIGALDDEGRIVDELPAKDWRKAQQQEQASTAKTSGNAGGVEPPPVPEPRASRKPRSN
jgi:hypothetical protein